MTIPAFISNGIGPGSSVTYVLTLGLDIGEQVHVSGPSYNPGFIDGGRCMSPITAGRSMAREQGGRSISRTPGGRAFRPTRTR
jgi:hypothetical protein